MSNKDQEVKEKQQQDAKKEEVSCETGTVPIHRWICCAFLAPIISSLILNVYYPEFFAVDAGSNYFIESYSEEFNSLIDPEAEIETVATGFKWAEGPAWVDCGKNQGYLLFSDVIDNILYKWNTHEGLSVFYNHSKDDESKDWGYWKEPGSNGIAVNPATGEITIAEHYNRRVSIIEKEENRWVKHPFLEKWEGEPFNSPNDFAFFANGNFYFSDPPYGLQDVSSGGQLENHPNRRLKFNGIYFVDRKKPALKLVEAKMTRPNGMALSPDEKTLYVANSDPNDVYIKAFTVKEDGSLENGRTFANFTYWKLQRANEALKLSPEIGIWHPSGPGIADGMTMSPTGHLFASGPNGIYVFNPSGQHLGSILISVVDNLRTGNCIFGADGWLYIAADNRIVRVKTKINAPLPKPRPIYCYHWSYDLRGKKPEPSSQGEPAT